MDRGSSGSSIKISVLLDHIYTMVLIVPQSRKRVPAEYLWGSPSGDPSGKERYTGIEQGVRGYSIVPLVFFSQSTVFSKRGFWIVVVVVS